MPVSFLSDEQALRYGSFVGEPTSEQLARADGVENLWRGVCGGPPGTGASGLSDAPPVTFDVHLEDGGVVDEPIDSGERHRGIWEDPVPLGITAVLHTWGSALTYHPHVHMIVPGGGIALDGTRWISSRPAFLLPVRVLPGAS